MKKTLYLRQWLLAMDRFELRLRTKQGQARNAFIRNAARVYAAHGSVPNYLRANHETRIAAERVQADIATRDANPLEDGFRMMVGRREFSGKGAREDAARHLVQTILNWRDDTSLQQRATFRGFQVMSRGQPTTRYGTEPLPPDVFVKGAGTYSVRLNSKNPVAHHPEHRARPSLS